MKAASALGRCWTESGTVDLPYGPERGATG